MTAIPNGLKTAYGDVLSHQNQPYVLPSDPNDFRVEEHFHALDRACHNDIQYLTETIQWADTQEEDTDPCSTQFLRDCCLQAKRLRLWNIEAFNAIGEDWEARLRCNSGWDCPSDEVMDLLERRQQKRFTEVQS